MLAEPMRSVGLSMPSQLRTVPAAPARPAARQAHADVRLLLSTLGPGLVNLGNTCYMNAILQCIAHLPPFAQFCDREGHQRECRARQPCVACLLEAHVRQALRCRARVGGGDDAVLYPRQLHQQLPRLSTEFVFGRQEDAHEFYVMLLDAAERQSMERREKPPCGAPRSHIAALFEGNMCSEVRCLRCQHSSASHQPFTAVPLDICGRDTLPEALQAFRTTERLTGSNQYRCDKCRTLTDAVKTLRLDRAGPVLAFHLKRFDGLFGGKLRHHVVFPQRLSEAALLGEPEPGPGEGGSGVHFTCVGVVVHQGCSARGGHYYAYVKTRLPDAQGLPAWHLMDDSVTERVSWRRVVADEAYILFYMRVDHRDVRPSARPPCALPDAPAAAARPSACPGASPGANPTAAFSGDAGARAQQHGGAASSDQLAPPTPLPPTPAGRPPSGVHTMTGPASGASTRGAGHGGVALAASRPHASRAHATEHLQADARPHAGISSGEAASSAATHGAAAPSRSCQRDDPRACTACKASRPCVGRSCGDHEAPDPIEVSSSAASGRSSAGLRAAAPTAPVPCQRAHVADGAAHRGAPHVAAPAKRRLVTAEALGNGGAVVKRSCLKRPAAGVAQSAPASAPVARLDAAAETRTVAGVDGRRGAVGQDALREIGAEMKARFLQSPAIRASIRARLERVRDQIALSASVDKRGLDAWQSFSGKQALLDGFRQTFLNIDRPASLEAYEVARASLREISERLEADARARRKASKRGKSKM